jgi:hypothetical protein
MELRIDHGLESSEVQRRLAQLAGDHGITLSPSGDGSSGELEKRVMLIGAVRATYRIATAHLELQVTQRPAGLPEGTLRRMLEDELTRALG